MSQNGQREYCSRCGRRRYIENLTLVFKHPILNKKGVYLCNDKHWKHGQCDVAMLPEIMMYSDTGRLVISIAK